MTIDVQQLATHLANAPHHWLGITPLPAEPPRSPLCALFKERNMQAFHYALESAREYWPEATTMGLMGSDAELTRGANTYPPAFKRLEDPEQLMAFDVGDQPSETATQPAGNQDPSTLGPATGHQPSYNQLPPGDRAYPKYGR